jgi:hypothetical protein
MIPSKPDLIILPFKAALLGTGTPLTLERTLRLLSSKDKDRVLIERSYPGAPQVIGWTIFRRISRKYLYENEPLFRFERGARRYIRKAYAIQYSLASDDCLTHSHLYL